MFMLQLNINPSSGIPLYKQMVEQIERMILNGYLLPDVFLPSVRQLAIELEVNPMTISKAYGLLEERNLVVRLRGKGMVVAQQNNHTVKNDKLSLINKRIDDLLLEAKQMNITHKQLMECINEKLAAADKEQGEK